MGGTDFNVAINAFSERVENKIIFTNCEEGAIVASNITYFRYDGSDWKDAFELKSGTNKTYYNNLDTALNESVDGDTISIPRGTFNMNSPLTITKGITIKGEGSDKTILKGKLNTTTPQAFIINMGGATKTFIVDGIHFTEFGGNVNKKGGIIDMVDASNNVNTTVKFINSTITKFSRHALRTKAGHLIVDNVTIDGAFPSSTIENTAEANSWYRTAIEVSGDEGEQPKATITNSTIKNIKIKNKEFGNTAYGGWENSIADITNTKFINCEKGISIENYYVEDVADFPEGKVNISSTNTFTDCIFNYELTKVIWPQNYYVVDYSNESYGWTANNYYYYYNNYYATYNYYNKKYSTIDAALENVDLSSNILAIVKGTYDENILFEKLVANNTIFLTNNVEKYKALVQEYGKENVFMTKELDNKIVLVKYSELNSSSSIEVDVSKNITTISKNIFKDLEEDIITISKYNDDNLETTWSFNKSDITDTTIDLNLTTVISENKPELIDLSVIDDKKDNLFITFNHVGKLPGKAKVSFYTEYKEGATLNLYYYNESTKKLELVNEGIVVTKDKMVTISIDHCSDYVLVPVNIVNPKTGDSVILYIGLIILSAVTLLVLSKKNIKAR